MSYFTHTNIRSGNFCEPSVGIPGGVNISAHPPVILYKHCNNYINCNIIFTYKVELSVLMTADNPPPFSPGTADCWKSKNSPCSALLLYLSTN